MDDTYEMLSPDTFWILMDEARKYSRGDQTGFVNCLTDWLMFSGSSDNIRNFQDFMDAYMDIANRDELRDAFTAAGGSCSDVEFYSFRAWLISQGKEFYTSALKNPGTLSNVIPYADCSFHRLTRTGKKAFACMTSQTFESDLDAESYPRLVEELRRDIMSGQNAVTDVSPETPEKPEGDVWNPEKREIQESRSTAKKGHIRHDRAR